MKKSILQTGLILAGVCLSTSALAEIKLNGFASIKAGVLFDEANDLNGDGEISEFEPIFNNLYDKDLSFKPESVFALQVSSDLGEGLSFTAQLYAEGRNDFDIEARWAYLSYDLSDEWRVNVGRMVLPMFYKSEFEKVGYTVNGNRLPRSVYGDFNYSVVEGVRLNNSTELGDWTVNSSFGYYSWDGSFEAEGVDYKASFDHIISASTEFTYDWLTLFAGGFITEVDLSVFDEEFLSPRVLGAAQLYGVSPSVAAELKDAVKLSGDGQYYYLGFGVDYNDWLITAEYADYGIKDSGDTVNQSYYVMLGKRIDEFTIIYTYENYKDPRDHSQVEEFTGTANVIGKSIIDQLLTNNYITQTLSLRYDFHSNAAFKIDVFNSKVTDINTTFAENSGSQAGMSIGVDLVF